MDYRAYPTQREAAAMLRVSASTLSRKRLDGVRVGRREIRLPAQVVLEAARANNWAPAEAVARALINYAQTHCPEAAPQVADQIDHWLAGATRPALEREVFLAEAERALPPGLFSAILEYFPASLPADAEAEDSLVAHAPASDGGD
jgi:hypothetical protein